MTNSASMELGYMDFVGDFSVIWTFSIINCSIWTILAGTNVVHISEIGCIDYLNPDVFKIQCARENTSPSLRINEFSRRPPFSRVFLQKECWYVTRNDSGSFYKFVSESNV